MYSDMVNLSNYLSDFRISQVLVQTVNSTPVCLTHTHTKIVGETALEDALIFYMKVYSEAVVWRCS